MKYTVRQQKSMLCTEVLDCAIWLLEEQTLKICLFATLRTSRWTSQFFPQHRCYNNTLSIKYICKHLYLSLITQVLYEEAPPWTKFQRHNLLPEKMVKHLGIWWRLNPDLTIFRRIIINKRLSVHLVPDCFFVLTFIWMWEL